jgi:hypothetical protein
LAFKRRILARNGAAFLGSLNGKKVPEKGRKK